MRFSGRNRAVTAQASLLLLAIACLCALRLSASPRQGGAAPAKEDVGI